jgi:hypothetical protein
VAIGLAMAIAGIAQALAAIRARVRTRTMMVAAAVALVLFVGVGGVARALRDDEPFRIASAAGVRRATVHLGPTPCDFLAWEMMSWECSSLDGGRDGRTGLALPHGVAVGGERAQLLLVPSAQHGSRPRTISWRIAPERALVLRYAHPDGPYTADARVVVRLGGREVDSFVVERGGVHERRVDTSEHAGEHVELSIEMTAASRGRAAVAIDGWLE